MAIALCAIEVFIAACVDDKIVRHYGGDFLVVILIYCFIKSFINAPILTTAISVLLFSFFVETMQKFNIVEKLGWEHSKLARIVIGTSFPRTDILAYILGIVTVIILEYFVGTRIRATRKKSVSTVYTNP